jgi:endonuclease/exonuclease/phosphatase family metal-dependent hydrolase
MKQTYLRWTATLSACACLVVGTAGCSDDVERETVDRVTPHDATTWTSRSDCEELLAKRAPESRPPRVGTWNIRFFPDSVEGEQTDADKATDVPWAACAIASLDVDVLAVQEFKNSEAGLAKQQELVEALNTLTGGEWQLELDQCAPEKVQHPGFLFDTTRVHGQAFREIPSMNPDPVCSNEISPGFAGYFSIEGGPDFHMVAVHGATGTSPEQLEKRALITAALEPVSNDAFTIDPDTDILFAGDFNSVGCDSCDPVMSNEDENTQLGQTIAGFEPSLELLPTSEACTRVADDMPHIDHVLAAADMTEVPKGSVVHVTGICEEISCDRQVNWLEDAYDRLSDHCPLLLDLAAMDDD